MVEASSDQSAAYRKGPGTVSGRVPWAIIKGALHYGIDEKRLREASLPYRYEDYLQRHRIFDWNDVVALIEEVNSYLERPAQMADVIGSCISSYVTLPYVRLMRKVPLYRTVLRMADRYTAATIYHNAAISHRWLGRNRYEIQIEMLHEEDLLPPAAIEAIRGVALHFPRAFGYEGALCEGDYDAKRRAFRYEVTLPGRRPWREQLRAVWSAFSSKESTWRVVSDQQVETQHIKEEQRREANRFRHLVQNIREPICIAVDQQIVFANDSFTSLCGGAVRDWTALFPTGPSTQELVTEKRPREVMLVAGDQKIGVQVTLLSYHETTTGQEILIKLTDLSQPTCPEQIAALARKAERKRISQNMHDSLGQLLSATSFQVAALETTEADHQRQKQLTQVSEMVRELALYSRSFSRQLNNLIAECRTLPEVCRCLVDEFAIVARITILLDLDEELDLPEQASELEHCSFILQEALTNAYRHGKANLVRIRTRQETELHLLIEDDGTGGESDKSDPSEQGLGLRGIAHRMDLMGGRSTTGPSDLGGFRLTLIFPAKGETA